MNRRHFVRGSIGATLAAAAPPALPAAPESLNADLRPYLGQYNLPALATAVVRQGAVVAVGAVGTRRYGADIPVTLQDRFHIGSDTKAMTALLAGMFVESQALRWDSTVLEVFPELAGTMDARLKAVTLEQLLSHTSGIPSDNDAQMKLIMDSLLVAYENLDELRYGIVQKLVAMPLEGAPGARFAYANMGYLLVGAMLERKSGRSWEEIVVDRVFTPLALRTAGFGPQASLGRVDAPLGHYVQEGKPPKPMLAGPDGDNPLVLGPAGTAHLSVLDFATWAGWNAGEGKRGPALVQPETLRKLHTKVINMPFKADAAVGTPKEGGYGLGWGMVRLPFSQDAFLFHGGSNVMNYAVVMMQTDRDFAMVMMTNIVHDKVDPGVRALAEVLYRRYAPT